VAATVKLTPAVQDAIIESVRKGNAFTTACSHAGMDKSTGVQWIKRGSPDAITFSIRVNQAKAEFEMQMVESIRKAASGRPFKTKKTVVREVIEFQETREEDGRVTKKPVKIKLKTTETNEGNEADWKAAESWLIRQNPSEWKPKDQLESSGEIRVIYEDGANSHPAEVPSGTDGSLDEPEEI
jgi:hypothetical protein